MEVIYQPFFAGHCFLRIFVLAACFAAVGLFVSMIVWIVARYRPQARQYVRAPFWIGAAFGVTAAASIPFSSSESMVRVATDWANLEYRYCVGTNLQIKTYALSDVVRMEYRRTAVKKKLSKRKIERVSHYMDIFVKSRTTPITLSLDGFSFEVDLDAAERLAPNVVAEFRASR